jgi:hypothetical protein
MKLRNLVKAKAWTNGGTEDLTSDVVHFSSSVQRDV